MMFTLLRGLVDGRESKPAPSDGLQWTLGLFANAV